MLPPDTLIKERYRIVQSIGQGGMGAVYEAIDESLHNRVALKQMIVSGEPLTRAFRREAHLLAGLRHPALPKVIDYFQHENGHFLVMEYIPGLDLAQLQKQQGQPFPFGEVMAWLDQLLDALEYLHTQGQPIIHRDIKPQNLKRMPDGSIVLIDFGLAKGSTSSSAETATSVSLFGYTPQYAPLEQIRAQGTDARSDLYSLAATVYQLLTSTPPVNALERVAATIEGKPDPLRPLHEVNPQVPANISMVLMRALALKMEDRPDSAAALRAELTTTRPPRTIQFANTSTTVPLEKQQPPLAAPTTTSQMPLVIGCVGLLLVMIVATGLLAYAALNMDINQVLVWAAPTSTAINRNGDDIPRRTPMTRSPTEPIAISEATPTPLPRPTRPAEELPTPALPNVALTFGSKGTGEGQFQDARYLAVDSAGSIFVGDFETGKVQQFAADGTYLNGWLTRGENPLLDVATDQQGHVYAIRDGTIWQHDGITGELLTSFSYGGAYMESMIMLPDGSLAAASTGISDDLYIFDAQGQVINHFPEFISAQSGESELDIHLATDGQGTIFALGNFTGAVFKFGQDGTFLGEFGSREPLSIHGIAVDEQSRAYLIFSTSDYIRVFDANGNEVDRMGSAEGVESFPRDITFDAEGNMYVLTTDQEITRLRPYKPAR